MEEKCFHCGLVCDQVVEGEIAQKARSFCCIGCLSVAQAIEAGGLGRYYDYRDKDSQTPFNQTKSAPTLSQNSEAFECFDDPVVQQTFVDVASNSASQLDAKTECVAAHLYIGNLHCAACVWLIEKSLEKEPGVAQVAVQASNAHAKIQFDPTTIKLSRLFFLLNRIGFNPQPLTANAQRQVWAKEQKEDLLRLGVAGLGMMQVGMVAVALHAGGLQGIESHWQAVLRWVSLLITTPVLIFSAKPFLVSAWRALRVKALTMDVPVSLALILAFTASAVATVTNTGEVYFDSVNMFTFFLLLGRYLEKRLRTKNFYAAVQSGQLLPYSCLAEREGQIHTLPSAQLKPDDIVVVEPGAVLPCDGILVQGESHFNESILTGESKAVAKSVGQPVFAGTVNSDAMIRVKATATNSNTKLADINRLAANAAFQRPHFVTIADAIAARFVAVVLVIATVTFTGWTFIDASKAFWVALSVLVVTCPCALSLATPTALAAALHRLRTNHVLVANANMFERLNSVDTVVFDKTGTLTSGKLQVSEVVLIDNLAADHIPCQKQLDKNSILHLAAALEKHAKHPVAQAFASINSVVKADDIHIQGGMGVSGEIEGVTYRIGKPQFAAPSHSLSYPDAGLWIVLSAQQKNQSAAIPLAWIKCEDSIRPSAFDCIDTLKRVSRTVHIFSGDRAVNVASVGEQLGIDHVHADMLPEQKLQALSALQEKGHKVLVIGDGINDGPMLAQADVSVVMSSATAFAREKADCILLNEDLGLVDHLFRTSKRVKRVITHNIAWAFGYNALALPLAVAGLVPPWAAAIGMSLSSLVVSLNAMIAFRQK